MSRWSGGGSGDGRSEDNRAGRQKKPKRSSGKPDLRIWYAKGFANAIPSVVAGGVGLVSTGSAAIAAVAAAAVTAVTSPAVESWFKGRELRAQDAALAASTASELGSDGAMGRALVTIGTVYQLIDEIRGRAEVCRRSLEDGRSGLAAVLGGGSMVPRQVQETFDLNCQAQDDLKRLCSEMGQASAALRRFQASLN